MKRRQNLWRSSRCVSSMKHVRKASENNLISSEIFLEQSWHNSYFLFYLGCENQNMKKKKRFHLRSQLFVDFQNNVTTFSTF